MAVITDANFTSLNRYISIDKPNKTECIHHAYCIIDQITSYMKSNSPAFNYMYNSQVLAGSYADDLKIDKPDEFDFILRLKLPFANEIKIIKSNTEPGYVKINAKALITKNQPNIQNFVNVILPFIDQNGHLLKSQMFDWFRKLFFMFLNTLERGSYGRGLYKMNSMGEDCQIWININGPAITLNVHFPSKEDLYFSLDLVIALELNEFNWISRRPYNSCWRGKWNVVPKPSGYDDNWIGSYAQLEQTYMQDRAQCKPLIRYFKKLRDTHNLTNLKSYYIKTVFLWKLSQTDRKFWQRRLFILFNEMLELIIDCLQQETLSFFWDAKYNMFSKLTKCQLNDIKLKLLAVYNKLEKNKTNPNVIRDILLTRQEIAQFDYNDLVITAANPDYVVLNNTQEEYNDQPVTRPEPEPNCVIL